MSYIGVSPFTNTVRTVTRITANGSVSVFYPDGGYTKGYVDVFVAGEKKVDGVDFVATDSLQIGFIAAPANNSIIEIVAYRPVSLNVIDWGGVNNKPDPQITLSGDASGNVILNDLTSNTLSLTLANTTVVANAYGNSSQIPVITVDSKGRITNATTTAVAGVTGFAYEGSNNTFSITTGDGSTFKANISANSIAALALGSTGVVANAYGNSTAIPVITIDEDGRISNATTTSVSGVTGVSYAPANSTITVSTSTTDYNAVVSSGNSSVQGLLKVVDSVSNSSATITASANSVKVAYELAGNAVSNATSYAATAYSNAVTTASSDATTKAGTAYSNAVSVAASDATSKSDTAYSNAVSQATTLAGTAYSNAVSTASLDAITKANTAYSNAVSTAASDATSKSDTAYSNAVSQATTLAGTAYSNAVSQATTLAGTAYSNAVSTAASDATSKAGTAYSNAVSQATTLAGTAYSNATTFAANADNISSGTLSGARVQANNGIVGNTSGVFVKAGTGITVNTTGVHTNQDISNTANVTFGYMTITGNLVVQGTTTTVNTVTLSVQDNMIYLNSNNTVTNPDLGFAGNYNDGTYHHAGFFRDSTDSRWKVFDNYLPEPDASPYIDTSNTSFQLANFQANVVYANLTGDVTGNVSGSANSATYLGGNTAGVLRSYSDTVAGTAYSNAVSTAASDATTKAGTAYSNATSYASNASNISSGTLSGARLPQANTTSNGAVIFLDSVSNTSTSIYAPTMNAVKTAYDLAGNAVSNATSYAATAYSNAVSTAATDATTKAGTAYSNAVSYADTKAGTAYSNATSYAATIAGTAYSNAVSVASSDATSKAATAYSNATSYAATIAGTAYSNATSYAATIAGTAYSNAVAYAASNSYVNSTFLPLAGGTMTGSIANGTFTTQLTVAGRTRVYAAGIADLSGTGNDIGLAFGSGGFFPTDGALNLTNNTKALGNSSYTFSNLWLGTGAYAPVFTDANNTNYYLNPYNPSGWAMQTRGEIRLENNAGETTHFNYSNGGSTNYIRGTTYFDTGPTYITSSLYTNVLYDSDNTSYYVNPGATTSAIFAGSIGVGTTGPINSAWGNSTTTSQITVVGSNYGLVSLRADNLASTYYSMGAGDGRFYAAYDNNAAVHRITYYGSFTGFNNITTPLYNIHLAGTGYASDDWRAPIFYDSSSTGYYVDPAGGANLYANTTSFVINGGSASSAGPVITSSSTDGPKLSIKNTSSGGKDLWWISNGSGNADGAGKLQLWNNTDSYTALTFASTSGGNHALYSAYTSMAGSARAPLFYDTDNTSYYIDATSTSVITAMNMYGNLNNYQAIGAADDVRQGIRMYDTTAMAANIGGQIALGYKYTASGNYTEGAIIKTYKLNSTDGDYSSGLKFQVRDTGEDLATRVWIDPSGNLFSDQSVRAPLFYDSNNTSYYVDPASNSVMNTINIVGVYGRNQSGSGWLSGNYSSVETTSTSGAIYSIGGSYVPGTTTLGNMYGIGYSYSGTAMGNPGGAPSNYWGMYVTDNGTARIFLDGSIGRGYFAGLVQSQTDVRAPLFYDYNDTGYYIDPASTTVLNALNAVTKSFLIDHPTKQGKKLRYACLEGPENGVYVRGKLTNENTIELPEYWTKLVDPDSITVSLTPIGKGQKLSVLDISNNQVVVEEEDSKDINCFYVVYGERVDVDKLEVEI